MEANNILVRVFQNKSVYTHTDKVIYLYLDSIQKSWDLFSIWFRLPFLSCFFYGSYLQRRNTEPKYSIGDHKVKSDRVVSLLTRGGANIKEAKGGKMKRVIVEPVKVGPNQISWQPQQLSNLDPF